MFLRVHRCNGHKSANIKAANASAFKRLDHYLHSWLIKYVRQNVFSEGGSKNCNFQVSRFSLIYIKSRNEFKDLKLTKTGDKTPRLPRLFGLLTSFLIVQFRWSWNSSNQKQVDKNMSYVFLWTKYFLSTSANLILQTPCRVVFFLSCIFAVKGNMYMVFDK